MQIMLLGSTIKLTLHLFLYGFPNICLKYGYAVAVFLIFCEFLNFAFNFAMQHNWDTAYIYVPQMVTMAEYIVLSGHLVLL